MMMVLDKNPAAEALIPVGRYSSAEQRPEERYQAWREGSLLSFGSLFDTTPLVPFEVDTISASLHEIGFSRSRMSAQDWRRTPDVIRSGGGDELMVSIRFDGWGQGDADGRAFEAPPGCIILSDFARPQSYRSTTATSVVLAIPRAVAERTLGRVRDLHGLAIAPAAATLLQSHAATLAAALKDGVPADHASRLCRITMDLLELGVARSTPGIAPSEAASATGARLIAERLIEQKLGSATLNVSNLCRWTGVSRSTLYRVFEADGGVQAFIRDRRLARVQQDLREAERASIADIAERWGFCDAAYLARLFRERFGQTPSDFRSAHVGTARLR